MGKTHNGKERNETERVQRFILTTAKIDITSKKRAQVKFMCIHVIYGVYISQNVRLLASIMCVITMQLNLRVSHYSKHAVHEEALLPNIT